MTDRHTPSPLLLKKLTTAALVAGVLTCAVQGVIAPAEWDRRKVVAQPREEEALPDENRGEFTERGDGAADPEADLRILKPRPVPRVPAAVRPQPKPQPPPRPTPVPPGGGSSKPSQTVPTPTPPITRPT